MSINYVILGGPLDVIKGERLTVELLIMFLQKSYRESSMI